MELHALDLVLPSLVFFLGLFYAIQLRSRRQNALRRGCQPPPSLSQKDPILGIDLVLQIFRSFKENRRDLSLKQQLETYGNTFSSKQWGKTKIFTIEPQNLQAVFAKDFASWGVQPLRLFPFEPFIGKGIMDSDGAFWEHSRSLIRPTFSKAQITDFSAFDVHVNRLLDLVPIDGTTVDLQPLFTRLALDSSTDFLFGESVSSLLPTNASSSAKAFLAAFNYGQKGVGHRMQLPQFNIFTRDRKFWASCKTAQDFVDGFVDKALMHHSDGKESDRYILAYELAKESKDRIDIRNQLLNIFMPAHDASAVALTNIFFHLARNPPVWTKLREEALGKDVTANTGSGEITWERLKSLNCLQHVISETLRLNPAIGTISRAALRDTTLPTGGGSGDCPIFVRKGDVVATSLYALHRRVDLYGADANIWCPERWESLRAKPWTYLPFGGGPRICPGQQLGFAEVGYTLVKFLERFKTIENRDAVFEFVEQYRISTSSKNGAKVALEPA